MESKAGIGGICGIVDFGLFRLRDNGCGVGGLGIPIKEEKMEGVVQYIAGMYQVATLRALYSKQREYWQGSRDALQFALLKFDRYSIVWGREAMDWAAMHCPCHPWRKTEAYCSWDCRLCRDHFLSSQTPVAALGEDVVA